jgi:acyl carrier protein
LNDASNLDEFKRVLRHHVSRESGIDPSSLSDELALFSTGLLDSLSVMDLVGLIEGFTGRMIPPKAVLLENFDSIGRIAGFVEQLTMGEERNEHHGATASGGALSGPAESTLR